jgi:Acetyltransferase (GNAT) domain
MLQHFWAERSALAPEDWRIHFLVRLDGRVIGTQRLSAHDFGVIREVDTGSWIGQRYQGQGIGTEMRAAVVLFAFDHLGATAARSGAFSDNPYRLDGTETLARRGRPVEQIRLLVTPETLVRPGWTVEVGGYGEDCRALLAGISRG